MIEITTNSSIRVKPLRRDATRGPRLVIFVLVIFVLVIFVLVIFVLVT